MTSFADEIFGRDQQVVNLDLQVTNREKLWCAYTVVLVELRSSIIKTYFVSSADEGKKVHDSFAPVTSLFTTQI